MKSVRERKMRISKIVDRTFLKFVLVGIINTAFGSAVMFALYNLGNCSYWVSSAANYVCGSILSFFLNKHFTFQNKDRDIAVVIRFVISILACYLLAYGLAKPAVSFVLRDSGRGIRDNISMLVGLILFTCFNYIGQRFFAFAGQKGNRDR